MSEPTGSSGVYGVGRCWIRWCAYGRNDVQTQYSTDPAHLVELYSRWKATGDGKVTACRSVKELLRARSR